MGMGHDGERMEASARPEVRMRRGERDRKRTTDADRPRGAHTHPHAHAKIKRRTPIMGRTDGEVGAIKNHRTLATTVPTAPGDEADPASESL